MGTYRAFLTGKNCRPLVIGLMVALLAMLGTVGIAGAQDPTPPPPQAPACTECHLDITDTWSDSPHAHAFDDPAFQEWWQGNGQPEECLSCHTTGFQSTSGTYLAEGIACEACHVAPQGDMGAYLEDLHVQKGIGCVDCHALVIPPETPPEDGIVPTGHTFTISPATCVACHTDALHAGFAMPGYENGPKATAGGGPPAGAGPPPFSGVAASRAP